jgi:hypothetical protein
VYEAGVAGWPPLHLIRSQSNIFHTLISNGFEINFNILRPYTSRNYLIASGYPAKIFMYFTYILCILYALPPRLPENSLFVIYYI